MVLALKLLSASIFIVLTPHRKRTLLKSLFVMPTLFGTLCVGQFGDNTVFYHQYNHTDGVLCGCSCVCVCERQLKVEFSMYWWLNDWWHPFSFVTNYTYEENCVCACVCVCVCVNQMFQFCHKNNALQYHYLLRAAVTEVKMEILTKYACYDMITCKNKETVKQQWLCFTMRGQHCLILWAGIKLIGGF